MSALLPGVRPASAAVRLRAVVALAAVLVALATAGCGLSTNDEPETIRESVPPDLLDTDTDTAGTGTSSTTAGETEIVEVYFLRPDSQGDTRLFAATREVPRPATQAKVLETLVTEPPTEMERLNAISTDVPEDVRLTDTPRQTSEGVLIVNLSDDFYELQGESARNAFAQIVFTATELPGVDEVQFEQDGEVFNAVDGDGQSRRDPLGRNDFDALKPVATPTTEPTGETRPADEA